MNEHIIHINKREKAEGLLNIEEKIRAFNSAAENEQNERGFEVLEAIRAAIMAGDRFIVPVQINSKLLGIDDENPPQSGELLDIPENVDIVTRALKHEDGTLEFVVFTSQEEMEKGHPTSSMTERIDSFFDKVMKNSMVEGVVINPWGEAFFLSKLHIHRIFEGNLPMEYKNILHFNTVAPEEAGVARIVEGMDNQRLAVLRDEEFVDTVKKHYWDLLEQARRDEIHSIAFRETFDRVIISGDREINAMDVIVEVTEVISDWLKINPHHSMAILFSCADEEVAELYRRRWDSIEETWGERPIVRENNGTLELAISMAMEAHKGATRKGKDTPYILHPIETLQILASMNADTNLMVAGILHDTLEDTDMALWEIYDQFGADVAALVNAHTENKNEVWYMRKLRKIEELPKAIVREKMLTIADKVSNLRSMYRDYQKVGDELWNRFNAPKHLQAWYYNGLVDGLAELQEYTETADVYWEMNALYKDLLVDFLLDSENEMLYQISANGEGYVFRKGTPGWEPLAGAIPETAQLIGRREAERIADNWTTV